MSVSDPTVFPADRLIVADLWYPRSDAPECIKTISVGLVDVRAADSFRIHYDFDRDGYVLTREKCGPDGECSDEWAEIGFVPAWSWPVGDVR